jgi:hypothetical protein
MRQKRLSHACLRTELGVTPCGWCRPIHSTQATYEGQAGGREFWSRRGVRASFPPGGGAKGGGGPESFELSPLALPAERKRAFQVVTGELDWGFCDTVPA